MLLYSPIRRHPQTKAPAKVKTKHIAERLQRALRAEEPTAGAIKVAKKKFHDEPDRLFRIQSSAHGDIRRIEVTSAYLQTAAAHFGESDDLWNTEAKRLLAPSRTLRSRVCFSRRYLAGIGALCGVDMLLASAQFGLTATTDSLGKSLGTITLLGLAALQERVRLDASRRISVLNQEALARTDPAQLLVTAQASRRARSDRRIAGMATALTLLSGVTAGAYSFAGSASLNSGARSSVTGSSVTGSSVSAGLDTRTMRAPQYSNVRSPSPTTLPSLATLHSLTAPLPSPDTSVHTISPQPLHAAGH